MLPAFNNLTRLLISFGNFAVFLWLAYWANRFYASHRKGENGITFGLSLLFVSLSLDRLWSVAAAIYTMFSVGQIFSAVSLTIRLAIVILTIFGMVFITWKFSNDKSDNQNNY